MRSPLHYPSSVAYGLRHAPSRIVATGLACVALALAAALLIPLRTRPEPILLASAVMVLCIMGILQVRNLQLARERFLLTRRSLDIRQQEFHSVFDDAMDAILILDDKLNCQEANPAAATLLGVDRRQLVGRSIDQFSVGHKEEILLGEYLLAEDRRRGQVELVRADGARIVAEFSSSPNMVASRHLLMLRDSTAQLRAEEAKARSLAMAKSTFLEAQALRNATLALTQSVQMNPVLDAVMETLYPVIPYDVAQVFLLEAPGRLFLAREVRPELGKRSGPEAAETLDSNAFPTVTRTLHQRRGILVSDTRLESDWQEIPTGIATRSWLGVPLHIDDAVIGILSLAHTRPAGFTPEHLRLAASLAIPVSLAIQNARLHERGEIFRVELGHRLSKSHTVN